MTATRATGQPDQQAPTMVSAQRSGNTVVVTYSERVTCIGTTRSQFSFAGAVPQTPSTISCTGTTVTLTFDLVLAPGSFQYTDNDPAKDADDIKDAADNSAPNQAVTVS